MNHTFYGYVRVSSRTQNIDRQLIALKNSQILFQRIFVDKLSGKDFQRPEYARMLRRLKKGDVIVITSLDRLGRNYDDILTQWHLLTKEKKVDIRILDMPLLDTSLNKDLLGTLISDLVLEILSFIAENERVTIKTRQYEGIKAAKCRGVKFGRPRILLSKKYFTLSRQWNHGEVTSREAAKELAISHTTFLRKTKEHCPLLL